MPQATPEHRDQEGPRPAPPDRCPAAKAVGLDERSISADARAEAGVEGELSQIYARLGHQLPPPGQGRVKRPDNYVGRIVATIFSFGIYMLWWYCSQMQEPNKHFPISWAQEDERVKAVEATS